MSSSPGSAERRDGARDRPGRLEVRLLGAVQGVGFRPYVFRLAGTLGLAGFVRNDGDGVTIEAEGPHEALLALLERLPREAPPAATIFATDHRFLPARGERGFRIEPSAEGGAPRVWISPDLAVCGDCLRELRDPADRRHRYPFLNCTHCGPRYTIVDALPYDRPNTAMRGFSLCARCADEYASPADRRFHAQPVACPDCGPRLTLRGPAGQSVAEGTPALERAIDLLRDGAIVALKGLGGYHLVVDARDERAAAELRRRKRRSHKAFAVMYPSLESLRRHVEAPAFAETILCSSQAPILILPRTPRGVEEIAPSVAPHSPWLGVFLPYTPLHRLLLDGLDGPAVATSGNLSDEPIEYLDGRARETLAPLVDAVLEHDRPILRAVDDSVLQVLARPRPRAQMLRRARGYTPLPLLAPRELPPILALGGQMNAALALARGREVLLSQHLGDLDGFPAREAYERTLRDLLRLYRFEPRTVAHDLHPDYFTTALAERLDLPRLAVQHHHAHLAACMLENGLDGEVLGLTWDGTGYGPDGTVWGGEMLLGSPAEARRVGSIVPFRLPGGEKAVEQPWRTALALLHASFGAAYPADLPALREVSERERDAVASLLERGVHAPVTTSVGRLFDGVSALLGLCRVNTHQAEAAQRLEWAAWRDVGGAETLPLPLVEDDLPRLDWREAVRALVQARARGVAVERLAAAFHRALVAAATEAVRRLEARTVALAGGVFCNRFLTEGLIESLEHAGVAVHVHGQLPPTDGSLAAGQLWVAAHRGAS